MSRLNVLLPAALLLMLVSTTRVLPVLAAEASTAQDTAESVSSAEQAPAENAPTETDRPLSGSEQRRAEDTGGVYRPSEDISEDLAVTFPVDI